MLELIKHAVFACPASRIELRPAKRMIRNRNTRATARHTGSASHTRLEDVLWNLRFKQANERVERDPSKRGNRCAFVYNPNKMLAIRHLPHLGDAVDVNFSQRAPLQAHSAPL